MHITCLITKATNIHSEYVTRARLLRDSTLPVLFCLAAIQQAVLTGSVTEYLEFNCVRTYADSLHYL